VRLALSYVLPLRTDPGSGENGLEDYLSGLRRHADVIVVDGSPPETWARNHAAFGRTGIAHLHVDPRFASLNGKVAGVTTGIEAAAHEKVVVADDDVRYDRDGLERMALALDGADLVLPQNYFSAWPWHALWDGARTLLNRALSHDFPGTLGLRRSPFRAMGGYAGDVLFENLELLRTATAAGWGVVNRPDLLVRRQPPTARRFWNQRIRQAYDDHAQPARMAFFIFLLPGLAALSRRWGSSVLLAAAMSSVVIAEIGRRKAGGASVFPPLASAFAPVWLAERGLCSWVALGCRVLLGGCRYRGTVIRTAAHSRRSLIRRAATRTGGQGPGAALVAPIAPGWGVRQPASAQCDRLARKLDVVALPVRHPEGPPDEIRPVRIEGDDCRRGAPACGPGGVGPSPHPGDRPEDRT